MSVWAVIPHQMPTAPKNCCPVSEIIQFSTWLPVATCSGTDFHHGDPSTRRSLPSPIMMPLPEMSDRKQLCTLQFLDPVPNLIPDPPIFIRVQLLNAQFSVHEASMAEGTVFQAVLPPRGSKWQACIPAYPLSGRVYAQWLKVIPSKLRLRR